MENELAVKNVDLFGDSIAVAQDKEGKIWAGVKWFCDGLGLSEGQTKSERKKIQEDMVLSKGTKFHPLGTDNANSDVLCLQLDYIPLWLAKISITPNMKENNPDLVEKLINYQLKAKDVLAAAFLTQGRTRRKTKRIGQSKTNIRLYQGGGSVVLTIGDEMYSLEVDEFTELNTLIPKLKEMDVKQIPSVVRAYLSLHESSPKMKQEWDFECDEEPVNRQKKSNRKI